MRTIQWCLAASLVLVSFLAQSDGLAVMSIDLGTEFMKIAIVKPGVPMEVALNRESRRKTPVVVSLRNGERLTGDPALSVAVRYPKQAYVHFLDLLGKTMDNPQVALYKQRFPYYDIEADPDTNTVRFKHDEETSFSVEELTAMMLEKAKDIAESFAEHPISDAVITVPVFFNQAERRAVMRSADLAGIKALQLISDNAAVALNYGIYRRKVFDSTPVHYMYFDMGSASTTATIVTYQEVKQKNTVTGIVDKFPQLTVQGIGFDRTLGGLEFQLRLRDHLARLFNQKKKAAGDVFENQRAMGKLMKEAGRLKQVLSANNEHFAQVESLMEDEDFRVKVTREEFEEMCADLFGRVDSVVKQALSASEMTLGELDEVILMGAGTRIPKIQEALMTAVNKDELGKSVNTDEAAALGAVYQAAHLSKGFRVKKFGIREATVFPIQVEFERVKTDEDGAESTKVVRRTLFGRMNPYPQKKVMTFNKHVKDFKFEVNYGDLAFLDDTDKEVFGKTTLHQVSLSGVEDAHAKHSEAQPKGVKAHFRVDESGLLTLDRVEAVFEKMAVADGEQDAEEESTLSKLGNTISNLFGGSGKPEADSETKVEDQKDEDQQEQPSEADSETESDQKDGEKAEGDDSDTEGQQSEEGQETQDQAKEEKQTEEKPEKEEDEEKKEEDEEKKEEDEEQKEATEEKPEEGTDEKKKEDGSQEGEKKEEPEKKGGEEKQQEADKEKTAEEKKEEEKKEAEKKEEEKVEEKKKEVKPVTVKEEIKAELAVVDLQEPSKEAVKVSTDKIKELTKKDIEKRKLEQAKNDLESYIIDTQDKLYQESYEKCSTEEEREKIRTEFSEASDWLYEQDDETERKAYEKRLKSLQSLTKDLFARVYEYVERPKALEALNSLMNYTTVFLIGMQNYTGEDQPFTEVEYNTLKKLVQETLEWNSTMMAEQEQTPLTESPKVRVEDFAVKMSDLDREVKYLINKAKLYRPKEKPKANKNETKSDKNNNSTKAETEDQSKKDAEDDEKADFEAPPRPGDEEKTEEEKEETTTTDEEQIQEPLELEAADTSDDSPVEDSQPAPDTNSDDTTTESSSSSSSSSSTTTAKTKDAHDPNEL